MTPEQLDAIRGRLDALGRGGAREKYDAKEAFYAHAESDIETLLETLGQIRQERDESRKRYAAELRVLAYCIEKGR